MAVLVDQTGRPLTDGDLRLSTGAGRVHFDFANDYTPGPLPSVLRGFHEDHPDMFDEVGIVPGGVATTALTRPANGGGAYTTNPANTGGAIHYPDQPGSSAPGIGGAYVETFTTSLRADLTYGGHYDIATGKHTEATAALYVTPDAPLYALGCWYGEIAPGVGIAFIGGVCAPPEDITNLDHAFVNLTEGTHPVLSVDGDGDGIVILKDGVHLPLATNGYSAFPVPAQLKGSTLHGFEIDQHIVDYTAGAPDLARMQSAVALSDFTMTLR